MDEVLHKAYVSYHKHEMQQIVKSRADSDIKRGRASMDIAFFVQSLLRSGCIPNHTQGDVQTYLDLYCSVLDIDITPQPITDDDSSPPSK